MALFFSFKKLLLLGFHKMVWMAKSITSLANGINIMQIKTDKYNATEEKRNGTLNHISSAPFFVVVAVDFCILCVVSCMFKLDFFSLRRHVCVCVERCGGYSWATFPAAFWTTTDKLHCTVANTNAINMLRSDRTAKIQMALMNSDRTQFFSLFLFYCFNWFFFIKSFFSLRLFFQPFFPIRLLGLSKCGLHSKKAAAFADFFFSILSLFYIVCFTLYCAAVVASVGWSVGRFSSFM